MTVLHNRTSTPADREMARTSSDRPPQGRPNLPNTTRATTRNDSTHATDPSEPSSSRTRPRAPDAQTRHRVLHLCTKVLHAAAADRFFAPIGLGEGRCPVGMLSLWKLRVGAEAYYLGQVAEGLDDYYTGHGEMPGRWLGNAAGALGLGGTVSGDDLRAVLAGLNPGTGQTPNGDRLRTWKGRVPGFDLTFSAPKSVSVLYALADPLVRGQIVEALDAAVDDAVGWLEREACFVRRGSNNRATASGASGDFGTRRLPGGGFLAAGFRHRTSRAGDPQLHTHVLVANLTRGPDGRWSALDAQAIYRSRRAAGAVYDAAVRHQLTARLGVDWVLNGRGDGEIAGIPSRVLTLFSKRRHEIDDELERLGQSGPAAADRGRVGDPDRQERARRRDPRRPLARRGRHRRLRTRRHRPAARPPRRRHRRGWPAVAVEPQRPRPGVHRRYRTDRHPGQRSRHRTTRREGDHRRRLRRTRRRSARRAGLHLHPPPRHRRPHRHAAPHPVHKGCGTSHRRRVGPTPFRAAPTAPRPDRRMGTPLDQPPPPRRRNVAAVDAATRTRPQRDARRSRGQRGPRRRRHVDARARPGRHGAPRHHPRPPGGGRRRTRRHRQDLRHGRRPRPLHDRRLPARRRRPLRPRRPRPRRRRRHAGLHHPALPAPRRPRTHVTARRRGRRSRHGRHHRLAPHHHRRPHGRAPR